MNILLVKIYCHLINSKQLNKLNLVILLWEKLLKNKKKIKDQGEKQIDALADLKLIEIKPKEIKPRNTKPGEYSDYFLYELARIRNSFEPVNLDDLIYNFTAWLA